MGNPGEAVLYDSEHDNTKPECTHGDVEKGEELQAGTAAPYECQIPCERPAKDNFWRCDCFVNNYSAQTNAFTPPEFSMPDTSYYPVKMGKTTSISDPVYVFPISIDQLVAAAIATRRALFVSRFVRWTLEGSAWPVVRDAATVFEPTNPVWNEVFEREVRRQHRLVCKVAGYPPDSDAETENDDEDNDPWINGKRRDPYDIRTFREIHAMLHAAYDDAQEGWLLVRNDEDPFTDEEQQPYHGDHCPKDHDPLNGPFPCCSLEPNYWDQFFPTWLDRNEDETYYEGEEQEIWLERLHQDLDDQQVWEMKNWRDKLVGENGRHSWIQENVVKVLETAFDGLKITVINATVLHDDEEHEVESRGIRNFIPMAWVHLKTEWKNTTNAPYVKPINSTGESAADDIRCHQGYAPVIPGDPGHWYSNAARDAPENRSGEPSSEDAAPLTKFCRIFELPAWLHKLQYLPRTYENANQDSGPGSKKSKNNKTGGKDNGSGSSNPNVTLEKGLIYHHAEDIGDFGKKKKWPAVVELRKVVHEDGEGEGQPADGQHAVDWWKYWTTMNPNLKRELERQENEAYLKSVQDHLDRISQDNPPPDDGQDDQNEQYRKDLDQIGTALKTVVTVSDKDLIPKLRKQVVKLQRERDEDERTIKNLKLENARLEAAVKRLSLSKKRSKPSTGSEPKKGDDDDDDDEEDDQPPKKKQKIGKPVDKGKGKADDTNTKKGDTNIKKSTSGSSPSKKRKALQNDTALLIMRNNPWTKTTPLPIPSGKKPPAKAPATKVTITTTNTTAKAPDQAATETNAGADSSTTTTTSPKKLTTKKDTKSPSKAAAAAAKPAVKTTATTEATTSKRTTTKAPAAASTLTIGPIKSQTKIRAPAPTPASAPSSSPSSSSSLSPPSSPEKSKSKAKPKTTKAPAKAPAKTPAKAPAKTPAKKPAAKKPAATAAPTVATASPASTTSQPTRTSRRQKKEDVELKRVSDPEKAAKKGRKAG